MKPLTAQQIEFNTTRACYWLTVSVLVVFTVLLQAYFTSRTANPVEYAPLSQDPQLQDYEHTKGVQQLDYFKKIGVVKNAQRTK